jgi:hypothetical protein
MEFTGNEDHTIGLEDAKGLTANYRESAGAGAILAGYFSKMALNKILNQAGCVGMRIYHGLTKDEKRTFVLVGVTADGEDITGGELAEYATDCPPYCPKSSELMSA